MDNSSEWLISKISWKWSNIILTRMMEMYLTVVVTLTSPKVGVIKGNISEIPLFRTSLLLFRFCIMQEPSPNFLMCFFLKVNRRSLWYHKVGSIESYNKFFACCIEWDKASARKWIYSASSRVSRSIRADSYARSLDDDVIIHLELLYPCCLELRIFSEKLPSEFSDHIVYYLPQ